MARNYGMQKAKGNYYIILDSDTLVPANYLTEIDKALQKNDTDTFAAPDTLHPSSTVFQKAVDFTMTHFLTTGGIRGRKNILKKGQLRSFNMGISKKTFEKTGGFSSKKIGEDIELSIKAQKLGLSCQCIPKASVLHQRKTNTKSYYKQCYAFGKGRALLMKQYPEAKEFAYAIPSLFIMGFVLSIVLIFIGQYLFSLGYGFYFLLICIAATYVHNSFKVGITSIYTTLLQMGGYGSGFLKGFFTPIK